MLRRKMKKFKLRKYIVKKDTERNTALEYLDPVAGEAVIWPAGGKVQAELYGLRLAYMLNMNYYGDLNISENAKTKVATTYKIPASAILPII